MSTYGQTSITVLGIIQFRSNLQTITHAVENNWSFFQFVQLHEIKFEGGLLKVNKRIVIGTNGVVSYVFSSFPAGCYNLRCSQMGINSPLVMQGYLR